MTAIDKIKKFLLEVRTEMKKVSWSNRRELVNSAWVVIWSVVAFALVLAVFDFTFSRFIHWILKRGF